jgi:hypothetical protein
MARLGMGSFLDAHPALAASDFATRVLRDVAVRLAIPETDGVWNALDISADDFPPRDWRGEFVAPELWHDLEVSRSISRRESAADFLIGSWRTAIRRYCRRVAGLGLRAVVTRTGHVAVGRTHLDVIFGVGAVDIRIRRAGLDANPHWLPWLGRVVQFHYEPVRIGDDR